MKSRVFCSGLLLSGLLVPALFAASVVVPKVGDSRLGISEALGCIGGGPGGTASAPTWLSLGPRGEPGAAVPIATDGFLPLQGSYRGLTVEQALAGIKVVVTDENGNEVPGKVEAFGAPAQQVFGWTATNALSTGQRLSAAVSAEPADPGYEVDAAYALEIVGPPAALPEVSASFQGWTDTYEGVGNLVSCVGEASSCGSSSVQVYGAYQASGHYVDLFSDLAPASGVVWEVSLAQSGRDPASRSLPSLPALITSSYTGYPLGGVDVALDAKQACAVVIVKDLRTGAEVRGDVCHATEPATRIDTAGTFLASCSEPPNAAVRDLWCKARTNDLRSCDVPNANSDDPTDPGAPDPSDPMTSDADASHRSGTSQSCQLGSVPGTSPGAWALCLAAVGVATVRRQRRS